MTNRQLITELLKGDLDKPAFIKYGTAMTAYSRVHSVCATGDGVTLHGDYRAELIELFKAATGVTAHEKDVAIPYLEQANWRLVDAVAKWRKDA